MYSISNELIYTVTMRFDQLLETKKMYDGRGDSKVVMHHIAWYTESHVKLSIFSLHNYVVGKRREKGWKTSCEEFNIFVGCQSRNYFWEDV